MLVRDRMTPHPIVVTPDTAVADAFRIIREQGIRYLPVLDERRRLVGIVTRTDLLRASPSSATTLTIYEANYLLAHMLVREVMSRPVTVPEDTPLEEAARLMVNREIGCLPVMRGDDLVGIITETDIFRAFVEILGGGGRVLRIILRVPDVPGELARLTGAIARLGGNIHAMASFESQDPGHVFMMFRLEGVEEEVLVRALGEMGEEIVHVCCTG